MPVGGGALAKVGMEEVEKAGLPREITALFAAGHHRNPAHWLYYYESKLDKLQKKPHKAHWQQMMKKAEDYKQLIGERRRAAWTTKPSPAPRTFTADPPVISPPLPSNPRFPFPNSTTIRTLRALVISK